MIKQIIKFFDRLEDRARGKLSRVPIFYAFLGGIGVVLFWRGVWHSADDFNMPAIASLILGTIILLITGAFVSTFIGNKLIVTGLYGEKRLAEKTEEEIKSEGDQIDRLQTTLNRVEKELEKIESEIHHN